MADFQLIFNQFSQKSSAVADSCSIFSSFCQWIGCLVEFMALNSDLDWTLTTLICDRSQLNIRPISGQKTLNKWLQDLFVGWPGCGPNITVEWCPPPPPPPNSKLQTPINYRKRKSSNWPNQQPAAALFEKFEDHFLQVDHKLTISISR